MADRLVEIASSGADYASLAAALAGEADFDVGEDNIIFRYIENYLDANNIDLNSGYTTTSSHKIVVEVPVAYRHDGTRGSGARIIDSVNYAAVILISLDYVEIWGLEFKNSSGTSPAGFRAYADSIVIDSCLVYDIAGNGVRSNYAGTNFIVNNIIVYGCTNGINIETSAWVYYCTLLNNTGYGLVSSTYSTRYLKNCYSGGSGTADYSHTNGTFNLTTCASSDGSESSTTVALADCDFTSYASSSEDCHIAATSDLIDQGTDLSGDGTYPVSIDFEETSRDSSPDIGADEHTAAGGVTISVFMHHYKQLRN